MTDPMDALVKLQTALDRRIVLLSPGEIHRDIGVILDQPGGNVRITYATLDKGKVQGIALFVAAGREDGIPCFQTGYAVVAAMRQKGLALGLVTKGIEELRNGLKRNGADKFYVEAVVGVSNEASNKLAKRLLSDTPKQITDEFSGEPALHYLKLIECQ